MLATGCGALALDGRNAALRAHAAARLQIERADCESYRGLVEIIQAEVPPQGMIFAIPADAELYFLANRRNPFRFYNTALGIRDDAELAGVLQELATQPPLVVTYRSNDKFNTPASKRIMEYGTIDLP